MSEPDRVLEDELLYRLIPDVRDNYKLEPDGTCRVTQSAFGDGPTDRKGPRRPSVYRAKLCGFEPSTVRRCETEFVVSLRAEQVRRISAALDRERVDVVPDPEDHPAHALIVSNPAYMDKDPKFRKLRKQLAKAANSNWAVGPPEHC